MLTPNDLNAAHPSCRRRHVRRVAAAPRVQRALGFEVAQLHPELIGGGMDPFLQIDGFALAEPVFAPHPHAGFSAVTYILPESPIGFLNQDSLGSFQRIGPGALHWTTAGRGLLHEEVPERCGTFAVGLQMFIDLPAASKQMAPGFLHLEPAEIPVREAGGATVRVIAGHSHGLRSPLASPTPGVRLLDVTLAPGAELLEPLGTTENTFVWVFAGRADVLHADGETALDTFDLAATAEGNALHLRAGPAGARLVVAGGLPLQQPVVAQGPFVMTNAADIRSAIVAYETGAMGRLARTRYGADGRPIHPASKESTS